MLAYTVIGTNDLTRALGFYDKFFQAYGAKRLMELPRGVFYGTGEGAMLAVLTPLDEKPATSGNGSMVALKVASLEDIKRLHALALTLGATDEGTPGPRLDGKFYCGYFRDLDHNKFNLFTVA